MTSQTLSGHLWPQMGAFTGLTSGTGSIRKLDSGLPFANGLAFGPDDDIYVSATQDGRIYKYDWSHDGRVSERREFGSVLDPSKSGFRGGDGIAFGRDGLLYATVSRQGDVAVLDQCGDVVDRIVLDGPSPTNLVFGPVGQQKIYVTEQGIGQFEVHDVPTVGMPLPQGSVDSGANLPGLRQTKGVSKNPSVRPEPVEGSRRCSWFDKLTTNGFPDDERFPTTY